MSQRGNNFHHMVKVGHSIDAEALTATTHNGAAISEPWRDGGQTTFIFNIGEKTGTVTANFSVRLRGTSTWKLLKDSGGTTITLTNTQLAEDSTVIATIHNHRIDSEVYDALRVNLIVATQPVDGAVSHVISDPHRRPTGQADLTASTRPYTYEA